jgi:hypothetical protein
VHQPILQKLRAYRAQIRVAITVEALAWLALAAVVFVFVSLGVDYLQRLELASRVAVLGIGLAVVAFLVHRLLLKRLGRPMDDERLAQTVEDRFPELRTRVISALQFAPLLQGAQSTRSEQSVALMTAVSEEAAAAIDPLALGTTLDRKRTARSVGLAGVAWLGLIVFAAFQPGLMSLWARRNLLMSNAQWPVRTHLKVEYPEVMPRGDALTVRVIATGELPKRVTIAYHFQENDRRGEDEMVRKGNLQDRSQARFEGRFKNVTEPLEFKIYGGDNETEWLTVKLVDRPNIEQRKFWAVYPHYTGKPPQELQKPTESGDWEYAESFLEVLPGTTLRVGAIPSKSLVSATLEDDTERNVVKMVQTKPKGDGPMDWTGLDFWWSQKDIPRLREIAKDKGRELQFWVGSIPISDDCSVSIRVRDTDGLENRPPSRFTVRVIPDRAPLVVVKTVGIGEMIVPGATVPLEIKASDDFGVSGLRLWNSFQVGNTEPIVSTEPVVGPAFDKQARRVEHAMKWDVSPLGLQRGGVFRFRVEATDFKEVEPKNVGKSEEISLRVVTREELLAELARRQLEQRQDFERNRDRMRDEVGIVLRACALTLKDKGKLEESQRPRLAAVEESIRHAAQEVRVVAEVIGQIRLELINNNVGEEKELKRLGDGIARPTRVIAEQLMPELADGIKTLDGATNATLKKELPQLAGKSEVILKEMELVLANMKMIETFNRILQQLQSLREAQQSVTKQIEAEKDLLLKLIGIEE